jgi:hypothetical protein
MRRSTRRWPRLAIAGLHLDRHGTIVAIRPWLDVTTTDSTTSLITPISAYQKLRIAWPKRKQEPCAAAAFTASAPSSCQEVESDNRSHLVKSCQAKVELTAGIVLCSFRPRM